MQEELTGAVGIASANLGTKPRNVCSVDRPSMACFVAQVQAVMTEVAAGVKHAR